MESEGIVTNLCPEFNDAAAWTLEFIVTVVEPPTIN
jgi:hypothetical protein